MNKVWAAITGVVLALAAWLSFMLGRKTAPVSQTAGQLADAMEKDAKARAEATKVLEQARKDAEASDTQRKQEVNRVESLDDWSRRHGAK